jgi:magnesium-transporting ATPase (P-type)
MNLNNENQMNNEEIEIKLWEYIDGTLPSTENSFIEKLVSENTTWKQKYHELLELQQLIQTTELEHPSLRFTKNVMEEIAKYHIAPATKNYINKKVIWGIAIFFLTIIVGFIIYGFSQVQWSDSNSSMIGIDLSKVDYSKFFNNTYINIFMMMNVVLGLMLLDRVLANKRKQFMEPGS